MTSPPGGWARTPAGSPANNLALLDKAAHEAPSGQLYSDMNAVLLAADGLVPGTITVNTTVAATQAAQDCQAVNPAS